MAKTSKKIVDTEDVTELNKLWIPLHLVKMKVDQLQKDGYGQYPLGDFILLIREIVRSQNGI